MIAAFSLTSDDSLLISLNPERKDEIFKEFDNDFQLMSQSLQVNKRRLYLLNPEYVKKMMEEGKIQNGAKSEQTVTPQPPDEDNEKENQEQKQEEKEKQDQKPDE